MANEILTIMKKHLYLKGTGEVGQKQANKLKLAKRIANILF